jgi:outer membrane receptor protein involved in Fe transport
LRRTADKVLRQSPLSEDANPLRELETIRLRTLRLPVCTALWLLVLPVAAQAQTTPPVAEAEDVPLADDIDAIVEEDDGEAIVVTGQRERGAVIGDVPPEQQLSPADIRAYGVNSISELLDELGPQTGSGRGRGGEAPVVLLDGRRIGSFREIREIPRRSCASTSCRKRWR